MPTDGPVGPEGPVAGFRYPHSHRLTRAGDFDRVRREGKRIRTPHLEVRVAASPLAHPRVGLIVPRHKHSAVARNGVKRRLREIARLLLLPVLPPVDVVVRARPEAYDVDHATLAAELVHALGRVRDRMARGG